MAEEPFGQSRYSHQELARLTFRRRLLRHVTADRIINISIGTLGIIVACAALFNSPQHIPWFIFVTLVFSLALLLLSLYIALQKIDNTELSLSREEHVGIARQFALLSHKDLQFETAAVACVRYLFLTLTHSQTQSSDTRWNKLFENLNSRYLALAKAICETAAYAISINHGGRDEDISVNIKTIDTPRNTYSVVVRSSHSDASRDQADEETRLKEFLVEEHMIYHGFLGANDVSMYNGVCVIDNIHEYVRLRNQYNEEKIQSNQQPYKEPSDRVFQFYTSCLVAPIKGTRDSFEQPHKAPHHPPDDRNEDPIVGILCVDSEREKYFDKTYDVSIVKQLAAHAYCAIRALAKVKELQEDVGILRHRLAKYDVDIADKGDIAGKVQGEDKG